MAIKLKVTQVKSGIGRPETQARPSRASACRGPHPGVLQDTLAIRGMIRKASHLVSVESARVRNLANDHAITLHN